MQNVKRSVRLQGIHQMNTFLLSEPMNSTQYLNADVVNVVTDVLLLLIY